MLRLLATGLLACGLTAALIPLVRGWARRRHLYAHPHRNRWHERPVPKLGGLAMAVVILPLAWLSADTPAFRQLLVFSALMFGVGLLDDLRPIGPVTKLVGQMLAAALFLALAPPVRLSGVAWLDLAAAFVWLVGITNAFNLLDNIDGLAAGVTAIAGTGAIVLVAAGGGPADLALGLATMVGAAAGFLFYNWQPASIFMGDSGSHLLGSFLAGATLLSAPAGASGVAPVCALGLLLLVPIADTALVALTRPLAGRSPFVGGRDHLSHRLVAIGVGERRAVLALYGLTLCGGLVAMTVRFAPPAVAWTMAAAYVGLVGTFGIVLGRVTVERGPASSPPLSDTSPQVRPRATIAAAGRARAPRPNPIR